jgi:hypothetical protein
MKSFRIKIGLLFLFIGNFLFCSAQDYKAEILKLTRIDLLPQFQENIISKQVSSYDTTGGNDDGFSGKYSFLREENGNQVIAELKGPGIIHRIWTPTPKEDTIQFFFDGEKEPRIELKFIDLFSGEKYPFERPVVGNEIGGYYCYLPIPFEESCKIVFKGEMQFIQIQYSETDPDRVKKSFPKQFSQAESDALHTAVGFWEKYGENILDEIPANNGDIKTSTKSLTIKPGETKTLFKMRKGGRIAGIEILPKVQLNTQFKDLILKANWDNEQVSAINIPLIDFFGYAYGEPSVKSLLAGVRDGVHYSYFPMPFDKNATLELQFLQDEFNNLTEIPFDVKVYYSEKKRLDNEGKFYAEWRREKPEIGKPYQILKKEGRGHHVGTILQSQALNSGMTIFFEGDDQCYIDGELRLHGTGSEDYFNGGWYALPDRWDQGFSLPVHGSLTYSIPLARTGGFRFLTTDKLSFEDDFLLTIEHGPENNNIPVDYISVAFYYCDTPPESNKLPKKEMLRKIETPQTLEYWLQMLPVKALSHNATLTHGIHKDEATDRNYDVYRLEARPNGFVKVELEVPTDGKYKLYMSYFKAPESGIFDVNQRQVPVKQEMNGYADRSSFVEKEYIGDISIEKGTNTITFMLKDNPNSQDLNTFLLHRIYLEKTDI